MHQNEICGHGLLSWVNNQIQYQSVSRPSLPPTAGRTMRSGQTWSCVVAPGQASELMLGSRTGTADLSSVRDPRRGLPQLHGVPGYLSGRTPVRVGLPMDLWRMVDQDRGGRHGRHRYPSSCTPHPDETRASAGGSSARATQSDHVAPLGQGDSASDESHCVSDQDDPAGPRGRGVRECRPGCDHNL
jgi:hypothetical protein